MERIDDGIDAVLSRPDGSRKRVVGYLRRIATALEEQDRIRAWRTPRDAADACRALMADDEIRAFTETIGRTCGNILAIAHELGYANAQA